MLLPHLGNIVITAATSNRTCMYSRSIVNRFSNSTPKFIVIFICQSIGIRICTNSVFMSSSKAMDWTSGLDFSKQPCIAAAACLKLSRRADHHQSGLHCSAFLWQCTAWPRTVQAASEGFSTMMAFVYIIIIL